MKDGRPSSLMVLGSTVSP
jgi:hypothetical protein